LFNYYSNLNRGLLDLIHQIQVISEGLNQSRYSNNYINMVWLEENSGQERGMLNGLLSSGEIDLWQLQPVLIFESNQVQHPTNGMIYPEVFIGLAEETGLIEPIGQWVLEQAVSDLKQWHRRGHKLHIAVNVSRRQHRQQGQNSLINIIKNTLNKNDIAAKYLKV
jgi:hypothetical protein